MNSLTDWQIMLIFIAGDVALTFMACLLGRHFLNHEVKGKYYINNLPTVSKEIDLTLPPHPSGGLFDISLASIPDTVFTSFMFSMTYGAITVASCNWAFSESVPADVGYLIAIYLIYFSLCFMCAFSENSIHIVTPHTIHFIYYGFAYIPMGIYWVLPNMSRAWLVVIPIVARLALNTVLKYYVWPNYPSIENIVPLYKLNSSKQIHLYSSPHDPKKPDSASLHPALKYEHLNGVITQAMALGGVVGIITSTICDQRLSLSYGSSLWVSMISSFCVGIIFHIVTYDFVRWIFLANYHGRILSQIGFVAGAIFVVANQKRSNLNHDNGEVAYSVMALAHAAHIAVGSIFIFTFAAAAMQFGIIKVFRRCLHHGDAGLHFFSDSTFYHKLVEIENGLELNQKDEKIHPFGLGGSTLNLQS